MNYKIVIKLVVLAVILFFIGTSIPPIVGAGYEKNITNLSNISQYSNQFIDTKPDLPDSYLIENIPYVNQGESMYCWCATLTMTFQYYGINTSHAVCGLL
jgi:hypothetical protein